MSARKTTFDPYLTLAAQIGQNPEERVSFTTFEGDSFLLLGHRRLVDPRPPLRCMFGGRTGVLEALSSGVRDVGDVMRIVRLDPKTVAVQFLATQDHETELMGSYGSYVGSIKQPQHFAKAWGAFGSLILNVAMMIGGGIETVLEQRGNAPVDETISADDKALLLALSPHVHSLRKFFDVIRAFYINESVWGRWEEAFFRSQKHLMGHALQRMTLLSYFLEKTELSYSDLADILSCAYELFDPLVYLEKAYVHGNLSEAWIQFELEGEQTSPAIPVDALDLKQVIDEIIYWAGASATSAPQKVRVSMMGDRLTFANETGAFQAFAEDSPSRKLCTRFYGKERISFSGNDEHAVTQISLSIAMQTPPPGVIPMAMQLVP
jgi:hypothetical protein